MSDTFDHFFVAPANFERTLAFYRDALGWRVDFSWGGEGEPRGAQLNGGAVRVVIAEQHDANDRSWSHGINGRRPTLHLRVEDLDRRYAQLPNGTEIVVRPERTHWGTRWFVVKDPDDNLIAYEQPLAQPT
jgi:uncharacterized glyoxalase superfamily protein PhnB